MSEGQTHESQADGDEIDVVKLIGCIWAGRLWIVFWTVVCAAVAGAIAHWTPPMYRAQVVAAVASPDNASAAPLQGELGGLAALVGINLNSGGNVEEILAVMRSREFSEQFIVDHGLMPGMFPRAWDSSRNRWKEGEEPSIADGYERFHRKVRAAAQDKKTGLVSVSIIWRDPIEAARLANDLTARLNREMRGRAAARTEASLKFLREELENTPAVDTRQAINRLIESQINQRMYANVTEEFALRVVDRALPPDPKSPLGSGVFMMTIAGALGGVFMGSVFVLAFELLRGIRARIREPVRSNRLPNGFR